MARQSQRYTVILSMDSEMIIKVFEERMYLQCYAPSTIQSYREYIKLFLGAMAHLEKFAVIPIKDIDFIINEKVAKDNDLYPYHRCG